VTGRRLAGRALFIAAAVIAALVLAMVIDPAAFAGWFGHGDPHVCDLADSNAGPRTGHPFGFDVQGCDLYANVIYGARPTVLVGLLVTAGSLALAVILGSAAGYLGGLADAVIGRLSDVFFGFPFLLGALVVLTVIPGRNVLTVSLVLVLFGWPAMTRLMRSTALGEARRDYVLAARGLGASNFRIVRKHILPNALAPVIVYAAITIGVAMIAEATLTFVGAGLRPPEISWGLELATAQYQVRQYPHLLIFPGLFLSLTVLSFITLGDTLRDALDPSQR
jgi:oligopeptide transport system permease protein